MELNNINRIKIKFSKPDFYISMLSLVCSFMTIANILLIIEEKLQPSAHVNVQEHKKLYFTSYITRY